jgi:hypothetical protein
MKHERGMLLVTTRVKSKRPHFNVTNAQPRSKQQKRVERSSRIETEAGVADVDRHHPCYLGVARYASQTRAANGRTPGEDETSPSSQLKEIKKEKEKNQS